MTYKWPDYHKKSTNLANLNIWKCQPFCLLINLARAKAFGVRTSDSCRRSFRSASRLNFDQTSRQCSIGAHNEERLQTLLVHEIFGRNWRFKFKVSFELYLFGHSLSSRGLTHQDRQCEGSSGGAIFEHSTILERNSVKFEACVLKFSDALRQVNLLSKCTSTSTLNSPKIGRLDALFWAARGTSDPKSIGFWAQRRNQKAIKPAFKCHFNGRDNAGQPSVRIRLLGNKFNAAITPRWDTRPTRWLQFAAVEHC